MLKIVLHPVKHWDGIAHRLWLGLSCHHTEPDNPEKFSKSHHPSELELKHSDLISDTLSVQLHHLKLRHISGLFAIVYWHQKIMNQTFRCFSFCITVLGWKCPFKGDKIGRAV